MRDKAWQQGLNKDATLRARRAPDHDELCDFDKTRAKRERDSATIQSTLEELLKALDPPEARSVRSFLKRFSSCKSNDKRYYLYLIHSGAFACVLIAGAVYSPSAPPPPFIKTRWSARWDKAMIEMGRKPRLP